MEEKYVFRSLLGKGSTGGVYKAECRRTGELFIIRRFYSSDGEIREGWQEEFLKVIEQLSRVNHPNVAPVIEAALDEDGAYIISDYFPTRKLIELYPDGADINTFIAFAEQGLGALGALHEKGIVHGRLGYDSIIVAHKNDQPYKFILKDYGLRRMAPMIQGKDPTKMLPTNPVFIPPELFTTGIVEAQTDLYMFGQLCYIMLVGCHPIAGKDLDSAATLHFSHDYCQCHEIDHNIPVELSNWVDSLTQPAIEDRPKSTTDALSALKRIDQYTYYTPQETEKAG